VTPVVIDASAGVEILAHTTHGRRLARLLPTDAVGWVPEHFYVEVAGVVRHQTVVTRARDGAVELVRAASTTRLVLEGDGQLMTLR
jgi:predicted nucleic acid-binding protein